MTSEDPKKERSNRRRFLATLSTLGVASLAGCSVETPIGDFNVEGGDETSEPAETPSPTPVETTRPPSPTATPTETPTPEPTATPEPQLTPILIDPQLTDPTFDIDPTLDPVYSGPIGTASEDGETGDSEPVGDPSATNRNSGGIEVSVTPDKKSIERVGISDSEKKTEKGMVCSTQDVRETAGGGGLLTENLVLNHRLNELWPGAIIPAQSVANGGYGPALSPDRLPNRQPADVRSPIEIALFIEAGRYSERNPETSKTVDPPTSDGVEQARVELLQDVQEGTSAAQIQFDIRQVHSEKHLDINLGVDYNNITTSISGDFSYSRDQVTNKILIKLHQVYYFMSSTFPNPSAPFVTDRSVVEPNDLLISDVSFGRLLLFSAESQHSVEDMKASLDATFGSVAGKTDVEFNARNRRVLDETRIKGQAIGGSATNAAQLVSNYGEEGLSKVRDYVVNGANYGPDSPGAPIGFTARYLNTGDVSSTYLTTEYKSRKCYPKTRKFRVNNFTLDVKDAGGDGGGNLKIYGDIAVGAYHPDMQSVIVERPGNWSRDRDQQVTVDEGRSKTLILDRTVEFELSDGQSWSEFMEDAEVKVIAHLREKDGASADEYQGERVEKGWKPAEPVDRTPTLVFSENNNVVHLTFDVSPVPLQN